jgi:hypothetical protein
MKGNYYIPNEYQKSTKTKSNYIQMNTPKSTGAKGNYMNTPKLTKMEGNYIPKK